MKLEEQIFNIQNEADFLKVSLQVFQFQYQHNEVYRKFCDLLNTKPQQITSLKESLPRALKKIQS